MADFDQLENKKDFRKMIFIIGGIVLLAIAVAIFFILKKESKESFDSRTFKSNIISPEISDTVPIFSKDISTWKSYYWPEKINTHYPSNWQFEEEKKDESIVGLKITPPTGNTEDMIFIGGDSVKCSNVLKYSENKCLKNKIQMPFYTNSKNQEVLNAFDLIFQNTILTEYEK